MVEISAARVKELRERTGAGLMDCKKTLVELNGDFDKAIAFLREKGLASALKKGGRAASEGLVHAYVDSGYQIGVLVEVNCETDFVAKNKSFKKFVSEVARLIAAECPEGPDALASSPMNDGKTVDETVKGLVNGFGENIMIRRFVRFAVNKTGAIDSYIHEDFISEGKLGVLLETGAGSNDIIDSPELSKFRKDLLLHIAAAKPEFIHRDQIPEAVLERERTIYQKQAANEGKSGLAAEKMVQGKLDKFYRDHCLLEQNFIKDQNKTLAKVIEDIHAIFGEESVRVIRFARFVKGEPLSDHLDLL